MIKLQQAELQYITNEGKKYTAPNRLGRPASNCCQGEPHTFTLLNNLPFHYKYPSTEPFNRASRTYGPRIRRFIKRWQKESPYH